MEKRTCSKGGFHYIHALFYFVVHSVHVRCLIKCLLGIFSLVWTLMSTKLWGFSYFLIRNIFGSLVVYLTHLATHVHFPCFGHALHIATFCTHLCYLCHAWFIPCFFILACHVYLILSSTIFCLLFKLHFSFISHPSCIIIIVHTFISCPHFSLTLCLFMTKRGRVYYRVVYWSVLSFLYDSCAHP